MSSSRRKSKHFRSLIDVLAARRVKNIVDTTKSCDQLEESSLVIKAGNECLHGHILAGYSEPHRCGGAKCGDELL